MPIADDRFDSYRAQIVRYHERLYRLALLLAGDPKLAAGLVLGGTVVLALVVLKWQPFRRAARSAELAHRFDAAAPIRRLESLYRSAAR